MIWGEEQKEEHEKYEMGETREKRIAQNIHKEAENTEGKEERAIWGEM
jgi:hypothetical protein